MSGSQRSDHAADRRGCIRLDDYADRGTGVLPPSEFVRVQEHIPSACIVEVRGNNLDVQVSEADLRMLEGKAVPLRTRVLRFGEGLIAVFGDFEVQHLARAKLGLFYLGGHRFNGFRIGPHYTALGDGGMLMIAVHLPSARLGSAAAGREGLLSRWTAPTSPCCSGRPRRHGDDRGHAHLGECRHEARSIGCRIGD